MKKDFSRIALVLVFFVGLSIALYPLLSNYWNQRTQSQSIRAYADMLEKLSDEDYTEYFEKADAYNRALTELTMPLLQAKELTSYEDLLDVMGNGIMGYISIEKIGVELPIYHGTSSGVLNVAVGHLEGSSLPVGGSGTHAVLSAHRGLPSAKLFSDLDKLEVGDTFTITVLNRVLTYEVEQILIVKPDETDSLAIQENRDLCSLITCTPYGINTHRLIVQAHRIESAQEKPMLYVANDAFRIDPIIVTPVVAMPMLFVLLIVLMVKYRKKSMKQRKEKWMEAFL